MFNYLSTGFSEKHGVAAGPMGPVVSELATLPKSDVRAIAHYLSSLDGEPQAVAANAAPQVDSPVSLSNGERVFKGACLACHSDGLGPKLFGVSRRWRSTATSIVTCRTTCCAWCCTAFRPRQPATWATCPVSRTACRTAR